MIKRIRFPFAKSDREIPRAELIWARAAYLAAKFATLTIGAAYVSPRVAALRRRRDRGALRPVFSGRVALIAHAYYVDLIDEILACYAVLPADTDLIVTTPPDKYSDALEKLAHVERVRLFNVPNRGRDIAPFLKLLNDGVLTSYDVVLKIHTKRSPHLRDGDIRRRLMFASLAGSRGHASRVLALFEDGATGLVGWRHCWRHNKLFWMCNRKRVGELAARMNIITPETPAFFEGSMFWVRPAALERLRTLNLETSDFESEAGQTDGTLHHAIERTFSLSVVAGGYVVRDCQGRFLQRSACAPNKK